MSYAVGIDLGTTNSTVSVFRRGVVETLPVQGRMSMPSVVSFLRGGERLVGLAAKSRMMMDPEQIDDLDGEALTVRFESTKRAKVGNRCVSLAGAACTYACHIVVRATGAMRNPSREVVNHNTGRRIGQ